MEYRDCKMLYKLERKNIPLISKVPIDEFTDMAQLNFDYEFIGESKFYPYQLPSEIKDLTFNTMVICGRSGGGKSTLLNEFNGYNKDKREYDNNKAIISNFNSPDEATHRLSAVGLSSVPVWCRPRNVLSVGEGFRADLALNINSYTIFDEFTSTIDRNVAKSTCNSIKKYIQHNNINNVIFCSCHKDYIPFLNPDIVIDLDDECVYDCRGKDLGFLKPSMCTKQTTNKTYGRYLGSFTI